MNKIAHIINAIEIHQAQRAAYLHVAQPAAMRSMIIARRISRGAVDVELFAVRHKDETVGIPAEFTWAPEIERYAWEVIPELENVEPRKPFPRMQDILLSLYQASEAPYFVYTNTDITLFPDFYLQVNRLISAGYDAFCINRLDLPKQYAGVTLDADTIELAFLAGGRRHPGIDCFVFRRDMVPLLDLGNVFVGMPPVGQVLKSQLERNCTQFTWVKDGRWTFHLGNDLAWVVNREQNPYHQENFRQAQGRFIRSISRRANLLSRIKNKLGFG